MARMIEAVVGHQDSWELLLRQMAAGHLPHAMAFVGPSGIGKKRLAWAFAQALVCEREVRPCGECGACRRVENQQSESVLFVEPEKGVIKLESTHQILQFLTLRRIGRARAVIIDSAQLMNPQATNALLKVLEEPPPETFFILVVDELSQLLPTVRSRVQVLRLMPLSDEQLLAATFESAPAWMVRSSRGSFERLSSFRSEESEELRALSLQFISAALQGRREGLDALQERTKERENAFSALHFIQQLLRDWTVSSGEIHSDLSSQLQALRPLSSDKKIELWRRTFQAEQDFKGHVDRSLLFENLFYGLKNA